MNDVGVKKNGAIRLFAGVAFAVSIGLGVWAFYNGRSSNPQPTEFVLNGWLYGREDQKSASAALSAAGLDDYCWEDGKLVVPANKKREYQSALAAAAAYPKAPSEERRAALLSMGTFESETKTRMRELDACAFQLERTIEQLNGVEYATVGVRSRREQNGLTFKNIVTVSVGVACKAGASLDSSALSAITVAAKHQLGVESDENISILDLKEGVSYFGTESSVGNPVALAMFTEKERREKYWRGKFLEAFDYIQGVRVSVAVDLAPDDDFFSTPNPLNAVAESNVQIVEDSQFVETRSERNDATFGASLGGARPKPLTVLDAAPKMEDGATNAFAQLGNPNVLRPTPVQNLAEIAANDQVVKESGVVSASYLAGENAEESVQNSDGADGSESNSGSNFAAVSDASAFAASRVFPDATSFRTRSLAVRIGIPREYVLRVAQSLAAENERIGATTDAKTTDFSDVYEKTEENIVSESKRVAVALLRPIAALGDRPNDELDNWVVVSVFSDVEKVGERNGDAANGSNGVAFVENGEISESGENAVATRWDGFGNLANLSERVAERSTTETETGEERGARERSSRVFLTSNWFYFGISAFGVLFLGIGWRAVAKRLAKQKISNVKKTKGESNASRRRQERTSTRRDVDGDSDDRSNDEFDDDLLEIASSIRRRRDASDGVEKERTGARFSSKRREAIDLISQNPDKAAAALQSWIKPNA